jgi:hypothetical protein
MDFIIYYIMFIFHSALLVVAVDLRNGNFVVQLLVGNHSLIVVHHPPMNNVFVMEHSGDTILCATNQNHAAVMHLFTAVYLTFWGTTALSQDSENSAANHVVSL